MIKYFIRSKNKDERFINKKEKYNQAKKRKKENLRNNSFFNKGFFQNAATNILYSIIAMIIGGIIIANTIDHRTRQILFAEKLNDILAIKTEIPRRTKKQLLADYYHYEGICSINISQNGQQQEAYLQAAVFALLKGLEATDSYKGNFDFSSSNAKHLTNDISIKKKHKIKQSKIMLDLGTSFLRLADIRNSIRNA